MAPPCRSRREGRARVGRLLVHRRASVVLAVCLPSRPRLRAVVARALEKDRDRRYATAVAFGDARVALGGRPSDQTPPAGVAVPPPAAATVRLADALTAPAHHAGIRWMIPVLAVLLVVLASVFLMMLYPHV